MLCRIHCNKSVKQPFAFMSFQHMDSGCLPLPFHLWNGGATDFCKCGRSSQLQTFPLSAWLKSNCLYVCWPLPSQVLCDGDSVRGSMPEVYKGWAWLLCVCHNLTSSFKYFTNQMVPVIRLSHQLKKQHLWLKVNFSKTDTQSLQLTVDEVEIHTVTIPSYDLENATMLWLRRILFWLQQEAPKAMLHLNWNPDITLGHSLACRFNCFPASSWAGHEKAQKYLDAKAKLRDGKT